MPLSQQLTLDPDPASVRAARSWITEQLTRLGRAELADAAQLGVSELVTNALLHANPPVRLRLRGTRRHPRIEVFDRSPDADISPGGDFQAEDLFTGGRGLDLVALFSRAWGSIRDVDEKVVWFEPTDQEPDGDPPAGEHVALDEVAEDEGEGPDTVRVELRDFPAQEWAEFRLVYAELRRELRLLALTHAETYPLATELTEVARRIEGQRRRASGLSALDAAIAAGETRVDLTYHVARTSPPTMARMAELVDRAAEFCREEHLLASAPTPAQIRLQRWYACEFVRQAEGLPPTPWPTFGG